MGVSVQSATGTRGVRISSSNAGYTMLQGSVKSTGYSLHSPVSLSLHLPRVTVCHHISTGLYYSDIWLVGLRTTMLNQSRQPVPHLRFEWGNSWTCIWSIIEWQCTAFIFNMQEVYNTAETKLSHYSPGQALGVPGPSGSQISRRSAHKGGKVVSHTHRTAFTPRKYSWYSFLLKAESTPGP